MSSCVCLSDEGSFLHHREDRQHTTLFGEKTRESFHTALVPFEGLQSKVSLVFLNNPEKSGLTS